MIARLIARGAQGTVLSCTEIMLLVRPEDSAVPLFNTTSLHLEAAVDRALSAKLWPDFPLADGRRGPPVRKTAIKA